MEFMTDIAAAELLRRVSERLNRECFCITLDRQALYWMLEEKVGDHDLWTSILSARPHLFSNVPVFLSNSDLDIMQDVVEAIEAASKLLEYRGTVLSWAPRIAQRNSGPAGAFMGYDFHLGVDGPKLIEVNTNAGGAFLNTLLACVQTTCCREVNLTSRASKMPDFEAAVRKMFQAEWARQRGGGSPRRFAIIDDAPQDQYLYPEFLLAQRLFLRHGIETVIADARDLTYRHGQLLTNGQSVDMVYNRLVDFSLERPEHEALRAAYLDDAAVVTPNPHVHALLADKRNLTLLSDGAKLRSWGLEDRHAVALAAVVPHTVQVTSANGDELWSRRRQLFFKPACGYGSKAAYRGDKLTKSVWGEITKGNYVAQSFMPPGERRIQASGMVTSLKADIRLYTYCGSILLTAARLYQGQTTNFRTPGGGFAPLFQI